MRSKFFFHSTTTRPNPPLRPRRKFAVHNLIYPRDRFHASAAPRVRKMVAALCYPNLLNCRDASHFRKMKVDFRPARSQRSVRLGGAWRVEENNTGFGFQDVCSKKRIYLLCGCCIFPIPKGSGGFRIFPPQGTLIFGDFGASFIELGRCPWVYLFLSSFEKIILDKNFLPFALRHLF